MSDERKRVNVFDQAKTVDDSGENLTVMDESAGTGTWTRATGQTTGEGVSSRYSPWMHQSVNVCADCGTLTLDTDTHDQFHAKLQGE